MGDVFVCSRGAKKPSCGYCGKGTDRSCIFDLRGKLSGQKCGLSVCEDCSAETGLCRPHRRLQEQRADSKQQTADSPEGKDSGSGL